jgi:hypothetical protein
MTNGLQVFSEMIADLASYCERKRIVHLDEMVGRAADAALTYSEIPVLERKNYPWDS